MKQKVTQNRQHSPSETQVARKPVKEVPKSLQQTNSHAIYNDLMGLSWVLFEEKF